MLLRRVLHRLQFLRVLHRRHDHQNDCSRRHCQNKKRVRTQTMQSYNAIIECNHTMQSNNGTDRTNEHNIVKPDVDRSFKGNVNSRGVTGWSLRHTERPDRTSMTFSIEGDVPTEGFDRRGGHGRCSAESALEKMLHPSGEILRCYSLG